MLCTNLGLLNETYKNEPPNAANTKNDILAISVKLSTAYLMATKKLL